MSFRVADSFTVFKLGDREFRAIDTAIEVGFTTHRSAGSAMGDGNRGKPIAIGAFVPPKGGCANGFAVFGVGIRSIDHR
jgi:hypothetical protein